MRALGRYELPACPARAGHTFCPKIESLLHPFRNSTFEQPRITGFGGAEEDRTPDPLLAKQVLSQLSYSPIAVHCMVGLGRFELPTSPLSGVRSNQLSYRPGIARNSCPEALPAEPDCSSCDSRSFEDQVEHATQLRCA